MAIVESVHRPIKLGESTRGSSEMGVVKVSVAKGASNAGRGTFTESHSVVCTVLKAKNLCRGCVARFICDGLRS